MHGNDQKRSNRTVFCRTMLCVAFCLILCLILCLPDLCVYANTAYSSYYEGSNITVQAQGSRITVKVPNRSDYQYIRLGLLSKSTGVVTSGSMQLTSSGGVNFSTSSLKNGTYYLQLWKSATSSSQTEVFTDRLGPVVQISGGIPTVRQSTIYDKYQNRFSQKGSSVDELYYYLQMSDQIQSDDSRIISRAKSITSGMTSAYDKAKAIHDWVATNIYYDMDAEQSADQIQLGINLFIDAVGTLNKQTSVCQGYADLTVALLRASGIPARTIIGYALTGAEEEWDGSNDYGEAMVNHAWVEAWLHGRWVLMDPTWDSRSIFYRGSGIKSKCVDTYFDSTLDFFSYGHYQQDEDDYVKYYQNFIKMSFADIQTHWGYDSIRFAVNNEIMHGMGDEYFLPDGTTTQAMFITMLANCAGAELSSIPSSPWYTPYINWAWQNGILNGMQGYSPDAVITREQMAVMLWNFIQVTHASVTEQSVPDFMDLNQASSWARDSIRHLGTTGIVLGRGDRQFVPKECFTRAEAATIVKRARDIQLKTYLNS